MDREVEVIEPEPVPTPYPALAEATLDKTALPIWTEPTARDWFPPQAVTDTGHGWSSGLKLPLQVPKKASHLPGMPKASLHKGGPIYLWYFDEVSPQNLAAQRDRMTRARHNALMTGNKQAARQIEATIRRFDKKYGDKLAAEPASDSFVAQYYARHPQEISEDLKEQDAPHPPYGFVSIA